MPTFLFKILRIGNTVLHVLQKFYFCKFTEVPWGFRDQLIRRVLHNCCIRFVKSHRYSISAQLKLGLEVSRREGGNFVPNTRTTVAINCFLSTSGLNNNKSSTKFSEVNVTSKLDQWSSRNIATCQIFGIKTESFYGLGPLHMYKWPPNAPAWSEVSFRLRVGYSPWTPLEMLSNDRASQTASN